VLILALDTTTRAGSLAISRDGVLVSEMAGDPATSHAQRLPLDVNRICASAGLRLSDIELFAVAAGPGSFTGLRVGISSIQGLAFATGRAVVPVSTLEAIAVSSGVEEGRPVAAWMDAQRHQVFAQLFAPEAVVQPFRAADDPVAQPDAVVQAVRAAEAFTAASSGGALKGRTATPITDALAATPEEVLTLWQPPSSLAGVAFRGDGAVKYANVIRAALGDGADVADHVPPLAGAVARIAAAHASRAVRPHAVAAIYVRRPDVELARERRSGGG